MRVSRVAIASVVVGALAVVQRDFQVAAHTWVDCIDHSYDVVYTHSERWVLTGAAGHGVCEGYAYNFPGRGVASIGTDFTHKLLPADIKRDAPVCQYHAREANYRDWRTAVKAKPGDKLFFAYFSNGHVVKDKQGLGTKHGVYWSGSPGVELERPSQLTADRLVSELQDFDDGNCGETYVDGNFAGGTITSGRAGDYKPCVGSFVIPLGTKSGTFPMVWYWPLTKNGAAHEAYSSCFDVIVEANDKHEESTVQGEADHKEISTMVMGIPITFAATPAPASSKCGTADDDNAPSNKNPEPPVYSMTASDATPAPSAKPSVAPAVAPTPTIAQMPAPSPAVVSSTPTANPTSPTPTPTATPFVTSNIFSAPLSAVTITGVGGKGTYNKITDMQCAGNSASGGTCKKTPTEVSGPIAPFDEDLTLALRGPLEIDDIAVFTKGDSAQQWSKVSSYSRKNGNALQNMVFLNNKGDPAKSGEFSMCHGNSQSFATADGASAASSSTAFNGVLADNVDVNIMSAATTSSMADGAFARGVAHAGWSGNHKIFMVKAQMPHAPAGGKDLPAIWLLNGQIVRSAQYGCNCRGMGGVGGCGELDVAEIIPENKEMLTSTIYSFKGSRGTSPVMPRPVDGRVVFVVILSGSPGGGLGTAQILVMRPSDVDIDTAPSAQRVDEWLAYRTGSLVNFDI